MRRALVSAFGVLSLTAVVGAGGYQHSHGDSAWPRSTPLQDQQPWEDYFASDGLYAKMLDFDAAWNAGVKGKISKKEARRRMTADLVSVASNRNNNLVATAARRWYRSGPGPYWVLLNLLEPLVFRQPNFIVKGKGFAKVNPLAPWSVVNGRLEMPADFPHTVSENAKPGNARWRVVFGSFTGPRTDLSPFLKK